MSSDSIYIKNLHIYAYHGVRDHEKQNGQNFYVSARLYTDLYTPGHSDDLKETVNYSEVCTLILKVFTSVKYDLIESAAYAVAEAVLDSYTAVEAVDITVSKPEAPVKAEIEDIAVNITLKRHAVYLGIGSNMGDRQGYIDKAVKMLGETKGISTIRCSSIIESEPYGPVKQDDFLNGVIFISTYLPPYTLLDRLHEIEDACGRVRTVHWGPRTLDLDILLYDDLVLNDEKLTIPHPDMRNREFVLKPLHEIAPGLVV